MRNGIKLVGAALLSGLLPSMLFAQESGVRIVGTVNIPGGPQSAQAAPGQIVDLIVAGVKLRLMPPVPTERFEVFVSQDGVTRPAPVRIVSATMADFPARADSGAAVSDVPATDRPLTASSARSLVMFTVPMGLHEGEASVVVAYRGQRSNAYPLTILSRPPVPMISVPITTVSLTGKMPSEVPEEVKAKARLGTQLERGQETAVTLRPLFDPDVVDVQLLVTFNQGGYRREVMARIVTHDPVESDRDVMVFSPMRYEIRVTAPGEMAVGPADIETRLRVNGQVSEPGKTTVQIVDPFGSGDPSDAAPRISSVDPGKTGIGQAVHVFVDDLRHLQPNPEKVLVVLEQDGRRIELKPEMNTARFASMGRLGPVMLRVRVGTEVTGKATLRVLDPSRGAAGLSEAVPIEIVPEVLAPEIAGVTEAANRDIAQLSAMREQATKAGYRFAEYDPKYRYVTIHGTGMDENANYARIVFQQGGRTYPLRFEDYSLTMPDRRIVRLPDDIKPGEVTVTIQNLGAAGHHSATVVKILEVTMPSKQ